MPICTLASDLCYVSGMFRHSHREGRFFALFTYSCFFGTYHSHQSFARRMCFLEGLVQQILSAASICSSKPDLICEIFLVYRILCTSAKLNTGIRTTCLNYTSTLARNCCQGQVQCNVRRHKGTRLTCLQLSMKRSLIAHVASIQDWAAHQIYRTDQGNIQD